MVAVSRGLGLAVVASLLMLAAGPLKAQEPALAPGAEPFSLPEPPALHPSAKAPAKASRPTRSAPATPLAPQVIDVAQPQPPGEPPGAGDVSVKEVVIEASQEPTPANPTGMQEPGVNLQWICPAVARLNQPLHCTIVLKSLSANRLHHVAVRYCVPAGVEVKSTEPKAQTDGDLLTWQLGNMEPRQEKRLDLHLVPTVKGPVACHAFVTFTGSATARLDVREPKLTLSAAAPRTTIRGDSATVVLTVSNPGDAPAEHVHVRAALTDGLENARGKIVEFDLDTLGPNEGRTVLVQCAAKAAGQQTCTAVATGDAGLSAQDAASLEVLEPRLDLAVTGPAMRFLERHAVYTLKVHNPGTAPASQVTLTDQVPPGFKVASISSGGRHDFASRAVVWFLGDLAPDQTKEVKLDLVAVHPGEYRNKAVATGTRGLHAEGEILTRLEGIPGLLMELVDVEDPVEVGRDDSYEIRVVNTGTKTETNLQVTCTLPEKMEFRAAKGPAGCTAKVEGREVTFSALPRLAPRADVIYRVSVHCMAPGDLRFQARMRADGLVQPVLREESTRVYGDEREVGPQAPAGD